MTYRPDPTGWGFPATVDPRQLSVFGNVSSANRCYYYRASGAGSISKLGFFVNVSSGNLCLAVYSSTVVGRAAMPGTRLATTGSVACPATGYAEISLGTTLAIDHGKFWFALAADNTTAQFGAAATVGSAIQGLEAWQDTAFPCPATPSATNNSGNGVGNRYLCVIGIS